MGLQARRVAWAAALWVYAIALFQVAAAASSGPLQAEVDLVFPRNDTYAPISWFPLVFAIQNASLLASAKASVYVTVFDYALDGEGTLDQSFNVANTTSRVWTSIQNIDWRWFGNGTSNTTNRWKIQWQIAVEPDCTIVNQTMYPNGTSPNFLHSYTGEMKSLSFMTAPGTKYPDIINGNCTTEYEALGLASWSSIPNPWADPTACPIYNPTPSAQPVP